MFKNLKISNPEERQLYEEFNTHLYKDRKPFQHC